MLTFEEMVIIVARHRYKQDGEIIISLRGIRDELEYQWAFNTYQVNYILQDMRKQGLI